MTAAARQMILHVVSSPNGPFQEEKSGGARKCISSRKAVLLIPLTYNDGTEVSAGVRDGTLDEIFVEFGGHTHEGVVKGAYRMKSGEKCVENLAKVAIVLKPKQIPLLRRMVARWCGILDQEAMYLEITASSVEFVKPSVAEEPS